MTIDEFEALFKKSSARINWKRARKDDWRVQTHVITEPGVLSTWRTVIHTDGEPFDDGRRLLIGDIAADLSLVGPEWREVVLRTAADMVTGGQHYSIAVPAINPGVILDGSHRCVALMIAGIEFSVYMCELWPTFGYIEMEDYL